MFIDFLVFLDHVQYLANFSRKGIKEYILSVIFR